MSNLPVNKINQVALQNIIDIPEDFIDDKKNLNLRDSEAHEFLNLFFHLKVQRRNRKKPLSKHTIRAYQNDAKTLFEFMEAYQINLKEIGFKEVQLYNAYISEKYAIRTAIRKLDFFQRLIKFGHQTHFYSDDYSGWIEKPSSITGNYSSSEVEAQRKGEKIAKPRQMSDKEAKIIINCCKDTVKDSPGNKTFYTFLQRRNTLIGWLLFGTGMRASEITSLTFSSFFTEEDALYAEVLGKGNKARTIPIISQTLIQLFYEHRSYVKDKYDLSERELKKIPVLFSPKGIKNPSQIKHMSYNMLYKIVKDAVAIAQKFPDVSPHWFRHTYITFLLENGVNISVVKDNAGHSNIAITNIYLEEIEKKKKHKQMTHVNFD